MSEYAAESYATYCPEPYGASDVLYFRSQEGADDYIGGHWRLHRSLEGHRPLQARCRRVPGEPRCLDGQRALGNHPGAVTVAFRDRSPGRCACRGAAAERNNPRSDSLEPVATLTAREVLRRRRQRVVTHSFIAYAGAAGVLLVTPAGCTRRCSTWPRRVSVPIRDRWRLARGPAARHAGSACSPSIMLLFVVEDIHEEYRLTVVVRGTNSASVITMLFQVGGRLVGSAQWPCLEAERRAPTEDAAQRRLRAAGVLRPRCGRDARRGRDALRVLHRRRAAGERRQLGIATTGHSSAACWPSTPSALASWIFRDRGIAEECAGIRGQCGRVDDLRSLASAPATPISAPTRTRGLGGRCDWLVGLARQSTAAEDLRRPRASRA